MDREFTSAVWAGFVSYFVGLLAMAMLALTHWSTGSYGNYWVTSGESCPTRPAVMPDPVAPHRAAVRHGLLKLLSADREQIWTNVGAQRIFEAVLRSKLSMICLGARQKFRILDQLNG